MIHFRSHILLDKSATVFFMEAGGDAVSPFTQIPEPSLRARFDEIIASGRFKGEKGEVFPVIWGNKIFLLAGLGEKKKMNLTGIRIAVRQAMMSTYLKSVKEIEIVPARTEESHLASVVEGILIGTYVWTKYRPRKAEDVAYDDRQYFLVAEARSSLRETITICEGMSLARDLVNDNADTVTSEFIEQTVRSVVSGQENLTVEVLNELELKERGLNLHLAVNQGSQKPPKLIIVQYQGTDPQEPFTAIVGKGLTFDTGGLNLKPSGSIEAMRTDMSGAAAVLGTLQNTVTLKLKKNILFVLGMAENAVGSAAYKPGDVFKSYNGKTVEIGNTDAEGRLVLADAISYVIRNYKPACVVDIATLTGACVIALGYDYSGLVSTDDSLAQRLMQASELTDDRIWRLPSYPELSEAVESPIADLKNVGFPKGAGGTITAAEFLRQFTEGVPWAHLDIAGTAFHGKERFYYSAGATGAGVRLLTKFLKNA